MDLIYKGLANQSSYKEDKQLKHKIDLMKSNIDHMKKEKESFKIVKPPKIEVANWDDNKSLNESEMPVLKNDLGIPVNLLRRFSKTLEERPNSESESGSESDSEITE